MITEISLPSVFINKSQNHTEYNMDYYKILGVSREASKDEIRKSYRKLAREYHPDRKPDDKVAAEKFKEIQQAYDVLGDSDKREQFDRYGSAFQNAKAGGHPDFGNMDFSDLFKGGAVDLGDILGGAFSGGGGFGGFGGGGGRRPQGPMKGQNARSEITISFNLAVQGGGYELNVNNAGHAEVLDIKIPPGVSNGSTIRLAGQGAPGINGGSKGDLLVTIKVALHPWFKRDGKNLLLDLPITITEAVLGAKVDVPTLSDGVVTMTIPPGTSSGAKLRLRGKGVPDPKTSNNGDQYITIKIIAPKEISETAQTAMEIFKEEENTNPRENLWK